MAQVAVAVADGDGTAVVATGGVELEACKLVATNSGAVAVDAELGRRGSMAVAIAAVGVTIPAAVGEGLGSLAGAFG